MPDEDVLIFPNDDQAQQDLEQPFARYVRSTLTAALRLQGKSNLSLGGNGQYDILTMPAEIVEAYQWRSIYCRPTKTVVDGAAKIERGLLCIGEAIGDELREAMAAAGLGTRFTVIASSEYHKLDRANRRGWVFNPTTTPMECQLNIAWSAATPDWQSFGETMESMRVIAALRFS